MRLIVLLLLTFSATAQVKNFLEVGVSANAYKGDLSSAYEKYTSAFHLGYKTNAKKRINFHFNLGIGNITGQNVDYYYSSEDGTVANPNKYFKTRFTSGNVDVHINLYKNKHFIIYLSQGLGVLRYKVLDQENNSLSDDLTSREDGETYSNITFTLPTNVGFIYTFTNGYGAGFQTGFLNSQSDYIDNISNWGRRDKKDNILMYKFTFLVPLHFISKKEGSVKPHPQLVEVKDDDKDGLENSKDKCPNDFGPLNNDGCPIPVDTDSDGVLDSLDSCPTVAGVLENNGCPKVEPSDIDSDGVIDSEDLCPDVAGITENKGCPEIKQEDVVVIEKVKETLVFETGKANILPISYPALDAFAEQLQKNEQAKILIEGHTDNVGREEDNAKLSLERAEAVKVYLGAKRINLNRIQATGLGSSKPIASNETEEGRAQNRRVEIILIY